MLTVEFRSAFSFRKMRRQWNWRVKAGNNEIIATGEGYNNLTDAEATVRLLQNDLVRAIMKYLS